MIKLGTLEVCFATRQISVNGSSVKLSSRAFDILELLINNAGSTVSRERILTCVWRQTVVEESNVQVHICALRRALGNDKGLIRTIPGRGYRLVVPELTDLCEIRAVPTIPARSIAQAVGNLPALHSTMIGRGTDLSQVHKALENSELVTLTGPGGVGKTHLAVEAAYGLGMPVCFVDLAQDHNIASIRETLSTALGATKIPAVVPGSEQQFPGERSTLVVLDTCEHQLGAVAGLCEWILSSSVNVRIMATSREPLGIRCEQVLWVEPLETPRIDEDQSQICESPSVQLFLLRARSYDIRCKFDCAAMLQVADICRRLDGIPLAIEFAAASASLFGIAEVLRELGRGFNLNNNKNYQAPPRHKSLKCSFEWSYKLLSSNERRALQLLSVITGMHEFGALLDILVGAGTSAAEASEALLGLRAKCFLVCSAAGTRMRLFLPETVKYFTSSLAGAATDDSLFQRAEMCSSVTSNAFPIAATSVSSWPQPTLPFPTEIH